MKINDLFNKTWKQCIIFFIIIFLVVVIGGFLSIGYLNETIMDNNFYTYNIVVQDKITQNDTNRTTFIVIDMNNKTYVINSGNTRYDKKLYESLTVGESYRAVLQDININDVDKTSYIIQVHNDTS